MTIDLLSSRSFADGHPHAQYRWLRENAPVYWHPEPDGPGYWAVTSAELVRAASREPKTFSSALGGILIPDMQPAELEFFRTMILVMDPPKHSFYRKLVGGLFTPKRAALWTDAIGDTVTAILDEAGELGECNLVEDIAGKLPSYVIAELLGIPRADGVQLYRWTEIMHSAPDAVTEERRFAAMQEIIGYAVGVRTDKLARPSNDLASRLVTAEVDGQQLTEQEFASFFMLLLNAGGDTTRNLIGAGVLTLLEQPEKLAWLRADPDNRMPTAVEELLRYLSPVIYMRRTATEDVRLGDADIKAGDKLALYYGAANHDPEAFDRPDELVLDRPLDEHFAFGGGGPHFCLGSHFGRIEVTAMLTQLLRRFPDLHLTGRPTWLASNFISGPTHVPVAYTPTAPSAH